MHPLQLKLLPKPHPIGRASLSRTFVQNVLFF